MTRLITLVLILCNSPEECVDVPIADLPEERCLRVMRGVWAVPQTPIAHDGDGLPIVPVDAWCSEP